MKEINLTPANRKVVEFAYKSSTAAQEEDKGNEGVFAGATLELKSGTIVAGNYSPIFFPTYYTYESNLNL